MLRRLGPWLRVTIGRGLGRVGLGEDSFFLLAAALIGVITAAAAVGFHELIKLIREGLYIDLVPEGLLYGRGILLLVALPAAGGLAVSLVSRYVFRIREGLGVVDIIESVVRRRGRIRPLSAAEKILTSALTIGSGGSAGAEGPIIQIGAGIAAGVGQLFLAGRQHMPLLISCGSAAGISAIFNAPIGGVLFTLEVIVFDFSIRTFAPVVLASVIANVTTKAIFSYIDPARPYAAIFALDPQHILRQPALTWGQVGNFIVLGVLCGLVGVALTRLMYFAEDRFAETRLPRVWRPALGGAMLGMLGVLQVVVFGWWLLGQPKPIGFDIYPMPAVFSDGYPVIRRMIGDTPFFLQHSPHYLLLLLGFLCLAKIVGTCLTLGSGGSGGIIAPSLFLGATAGGFLGIVLRQAGLDVQPNSYALVGMGAVLAAVVHAPLASILILLELTEDHKIIMPAMLATVVATGVARLLFRDSIYTFSLRLRGVRVGKVADLSLLRRLAVEQVPLEPAMIVRPDSPFQTILDLCDQTGTNDFVVIDDTQRYLGMVVSDDIQTALLQREAVPLLLVRDLVRGGIPAVTPADDLAMVLDLFAAHGVDRIPVATARNSANIIGVISRSALTKSYLRALEETS